MRVCLLVWSLIRLKVQFAQQQDLLKARGALAFFWQLILISYKLKEVHFYVLSFSLRRYAQNQGNSAYCPVQQDLFTCFDSTQTCLTHHRGLDCSDALSSGHNFLVLFDKASVQHQQSVKINSSDLANSICSRFCGAAQ